jgi:hypothetical protein
VGLVTGGYVETLLRWPGTTSAVVIGGDCSVADLPAQIIDHVSATTPGPDSKVLVCGGRDGDGFLSSCLTYSLGPPAAWVTHSGFSVPRAGPAAVTLESGVYVLGGFNGSYDNTDNYNGLSSSEFLAAGSSVWKAGPALPYGGQGVADSCAIAISNTQFLLIGGLRYDGSTVLDISSSVHEFNSMTSLWTEWPSLSSSRKGHACGKLGGKVVVAGGWGDDGGKTTEVIDIASRESRAGGDMATPRAYFSMVEVGYEGNSILLTFGSTANGDDTVQDEALQQESLMQEWDNSQEVWLPRPAVMSRRFNFAAVTEEAGLLCPEGPYYSLMQPINHLP